MKIAVLDSVQSITIQKDVVNVLLMVPKHIVQTTFVDKRSTHPGSVWVTVNRDF